MILKNKITFFFIFQFVLILSLYCQWENSLVEYYPQPVLSNGAADAYYPSVIFNPGSFGEKAGDSIGSTPNTFSVDPYYKMWFSNGSGIGFAYSSDGKSWIICSSCTISGLSHPHHVAVVYTGSHYYIWYWDTSNLYSHSAIRFADSPDGIGFSNDQATSGNLITGVSPDWNRGSYGPSQVFYNPAASNTGSDPFDHTFYMYFDGTTGGVEETGLGYSSDGVNWQLTGRVLTIGNPGDWDSSYASRCSVVRVGSNEWHMWYSGGQTRMHEGIGHATSTDGINWTRDTNNPIWHITDGMSYRDTRTYTPWILYRNDRFLGHGDNIRFKGWFTARSGSNRRTVCYLGTNQLTDPVAQIDTEPDPPVGIVPFTVKLDGTGSYDPGDVITSYQWDLGNGSYSSNPQERVTYYRVGNHSVRLTVTNSSGNSDSDQVTIRVLDITGISAKIWTEEKQIKGYGKETTTVYAELYAGNTKLMQKYRLTFSPSIGSMEGPVYFDKNSGRYSQLLRSGDPGQDNIKLFFLENYIDETSIEYIWIQPPGTFLLEVFNDSKLFVKHYVSVMNWSFPTVTYDKIKLKEYKIYRSFDGTSWEVIDTPESSATKISDSIKKLPVWYSISSVDSDGNESKRLTVSHN